MSKSRKTRGRSKKLRKIMNVVDEVFCWIVGLAIVFGPLVILALIFIER